MKQDIIRKIKTKKCIIDCHTHVGVAYKNYLFSGYPYCLSFEDLVVRMKYLGIDHAVVMPFDSSFYKIKTAAPEKIETCDDFSSFPYEVENKSLFKEVYEIFPEYAERALPFARFDPSRKTGEQAQLFEELYKNYPFFGLKTCTTYIQSFVKDLETTGRPILDFARRYDLPIIFHSSYDKADPWASVFDIVELAENHPELRVCIAHSARFTRAVLERANALKNCFVDLSAFDIHCLLARMEHRAIPPTGERIQADYNNPAQVMLTMYKTYPDTIIWGSDTPGNYFIKRYFDVNGKSVDLRLKSSFDKEMNILRSLPEEVIGKITYENTVKFLFR